MDFIFMLTRSDRTIEDCLDLLELIKPVGLKHIGFKDIGVEPATLKALTGAIHAAGATSYMEVVSTTPEACLNSARIARDLGVQRLLGGTQVDDILQILAGSVTEYYPFPGKPVGHPTKLGGTSAGVEADCRAFIDDMAGAMADADLLICRAGAMTVSEVAAAGVAALFVTFPHAIDDHQTANARFLSDAQAAWLQPQTAMTPEWLADWLSQRTRQELEAVAVRARAHARPDAAAHIADVCEQAAGRSS